MIVRQDCRERFDVVSSPVRNLYIPIEGPLKFKCVQRKHAPLEAVINVSKLMKIIKVFSQSSQDF